ncbi:MAG: class I adenylate-forming enzyme family protein, partial [Thermodesulfobacteriota bacterium]|nr:class I adenylate-forming enzyme family protein [Thermodesulfobacteriota bacterium]
VYFGTMMLGGVSVPIDVRLRGPSLVAILADSGSKVAVAHASVAEFIKEAAAGTPLADNIIVVSEGEDAPYNKALMEAQPVEDLPEDDESADALYLFTSGTTARPKVVVLTNAHHDLFPQSMCEVLDITADDVTGLILPMSHISGPICCNLVVSTGCRMVIFKSLAPNDFLATIQEHRVTWFHSVPPVWAPILQMPYPWEYDTSSLRMVALMGMAIPVNLMNALAQRFPETKIMQGYGLTETSPLITLTPLDWADRKRASMGQAVPGAEIKLVDDDGNEVPQGEAGELVLRGPQVMKGYLGRDDLTAEVIQDGWFKTGDIARMDEDGFLYHLGRKDSVFNVGGLKVYPPEVEAVLRQHPGIRDVVVYGKKGGPRGYQVAALVVPKPGSPVDRKSILQFCRPKLGDYQIPDVVTAVESIQRTASADGRLRQPRRHGAGAGGVCSHQGHEAHEGKNRDGGEEASFRTACRS